MNRKQIIDDYLAGRHPIGQEQWTLPADEVLDRDAELFDQMLAERQKKQASPTSKTLSDSPFRGEKQAAKDSLPLREGWGGSGVARLVLSAAAVLTAAIALFTWWNVKPQQPTQLAEKTEEPVELKDTTEVIEKCNVVKPQIQHVKLADITRRKSKVHVLRQKTSQPTSVEEPQPSTETVVLESAADSLYYYLTQLENQMGDCRDSACLAELTGLIRADERIRDLVNKIVHKQVETAYKEEYLVDTTTRYVPL